MLKRAKIMYENLLQYDSLLLFFPIVSIKVNKILADQEKKTLKNNI